MAKFIFITGGVVSSLGKGIASASIAKLLESRGFKLTIIKCDPYINVDPGTMNPFQHGEVYVTDDGAETDLDLGHYERFTKAVITKYNNITTGSVYSTVIEKERKGDYLGSTASACSAGRPTTAPVESRIPSVLSDVWCRTKRRGSRRSKTLRDRDRPVIREEQKKRRPHRPQIEPCLPQ